APHPDRHSFPTRRSSDLTNVEGTRNLLQASVDASVKRFIHFSTTDVYGYPGGAAIDETHTPTRFRNWYAQTKLAAEAEVRRAERSEEHTSELQSLAYLVC